MRLNECQAGELFAVGGLGIGCMDGNVYDIFVLGTTRSNVVELPRSTTVCRKVTKMM